MTNKSYTYVQHNESLQVGIDTTDSCKSRVSPLAVRTLVHKSRRSRLHSGFYAPTQDATDRTACVKRYDSVWHGAVHNSHRLREALRFRAKWRHA